MGRVRKDRHHIKEICAPGADGFVPSGQWTVDLDEGLYAIQLEPGDRGRGIGGLNLGRIYPEAFHG